MKIQIILSYTQTKLSIRLSHYTKIFVTLPASSSTVAQLSPTTISPLPISAITSAWSAAAHNPLGLATPPSLSLSLSFPFLFLSFSFPFHATTATTTNDPLLLPPLTGSDWAALVATDERWQQPWVAGSGGGGDEERERNMERKRREGEVVGRREL